MKRNADVLPSKEVPGCFEEIEKLRLSQVPSSPIYQPRSMEEIPSSASTPTHSEKIKKAAVEKTEDRQPSKKTKKCPVCAVILANQSSYRRHYHSKHGGARMKLIGKTYLYVDEDGVYYMMPI